MNRVLAPAFGGRARPGAAEVSVAVLLFVAALLETLLADHPSFAEADAIAVTATTLPLAWRSVVPVSKVALMTGGWLSRRSWASQPAS